MNNTYETSINHVTEGHSKDHFVIIETSEKSVITALEAKPDQFENYWEDNTPGCPRLVRFRIPFDQVSWGSLAKRKARPDAHLNFGNAA